MLRVGKSRCSANITMDPDEINIQFGFNEAIKDEVKVMDGARWNPERKSWRVKNNHRNRFALGFLQGEPVFSRYDADLLAFQPKRGLLTEGGVLFNHQANIVRHMITRRQCIIAAEMGCGKSLAAIEALEYLRGLLGPTEAWYCSPKVALLSVKLDFQKWNAGFYPLFHTYQEMTKLLTHWDKGRKPPRIVVLDESSRLKSPEAKMSQAALHLTNAMRDHWGEDCYVILMSGSPAPKSPLDWWMQCEIARPGFLREGTSRKFLDRMALIKKMQGESGIAWPKVITFRDSDDKCGICGKYSDHELHKYDHFTMLTRVAGTDADQQPHQFVGMVNEVKKLYARLDGLVQVTLKKDCLDLPEKVYRRIKLKPSKYMMNLAKMVRKTAGTAANALTLLRELSDGFQYQEKLVGTKTCLDCGPDGKMEVNGEQQTCIYCGGKRVFKQFETEAVEVDTPKTQALTDVLEELDESGRIVIGGAFQGTIDRICATVIKAGWQVIRRDGRGWFTTLGETDPGELVKIFQRERECPGSEKLAFIGHPKSISMGLTLTASDTILCYSNSFDAEDRIQFEDRIHRPGSRGANIIDLCHLPVDEYVLENLGKKRDMQKITLGEIDTVLESENGD